MNRVVSFSLLVILQVVIAEPPPPHCRAPPPGVTNPEKCCDMPHIFKDEDFKECGIERSSDEEKDFKARGPPDCSQSVCLLKRYNLVKGDDKVDKDTAIEFLDKWVEDNKGYKDAAEKAKEICLKSDLPGPPQICEATKVMFCVKHVMFMECPKWEDSENCKKLKDHIDECKSYFLQ